MKPTLFFFNLVLQTCVNSKLHETAQQVYQRMLDFLTNSFNFIVLLKAGWKPDCSTYCALIQLETTAEGVMTVWDKMLEMKVQPDLR